MLNSESDIEKVNNFENSKELNDPNCETIKKLLIKQNLYPDNNKNLKYLLSITLKKEQKNFDFQYLLSFLLTFKTEDNINIFYDYFFQCCELGKINYVTLLLNNHLSINYQNELGETPMHIAITKKDINLMKLLLEYNPVLTIKTYKDNLNCYNYADISGNEEIKNLLYSKINSSKEIKSKLKSFINGIDTKNSMSSIESGAKKELLDYCGETYKSNIKTDASELKTINEDEPIKINDIINITNSKHNSSSSKKEYSDKKLFIKKTNYSPQKKDNSNYNNSSFNNKAKEENKDNLTYSNKTVYKKKRILCNSDNGEYRYMTEKNQRKQKKQYNLEELNIKKYNFTNSPSAFSLDILEPTKNMKLNVIENDYINNKKIKDEDNEKQLNHFFTEINVPREYTKNFIDNGFDDLELLLIQTKSGIALSNQNLKDIGISIYGDRAKILIHLEEKAGIFPFLLEKDKIYITKDECIPGNNSLFKFLADINYKEYEGKFIENGFYSSELLFTQMLTRQPIDENSLKEEFNITKTLHRHIIYNNLKKLSKEYEKKLKNKDNNIMEYEAKELKECGTCNIY